MLLLLLAQIFYGTGEPPVVPPNGAKPRVLFSRDDYPAEAVRKHMEGGVQTELTINERGAVTSCRIIKSSGFPILDETTCRIIINRAVFVPAKDKAGHPVAGKITSPVITWRLG